MIFQHKLNSVFKMPFEFCYDNSWQLFSKKSEPNSADCLFLMCDYKLFTPIVYGLINNNETST